MIFAIGDDKPEIHPTAFIHPTAEISGKVKIGARASVWGGCVLRGDIDWIEIGDDTNVQDGSVFHTSKGMPVILGQRVTIGHRALVHGARVKDDTLIGMGAILLDRCVVEENCFVGAGTVIKEGEVIPRNSLAVGVPARVPRPLKPTELELILKRAKDYVQYAQQYKTALSQAKLM